MEVQHTQKGVQMNVKGWKSSHLHKKEKKASIKLQSRTNHAKCISQTLTGSQVKN